MRKSTIYLVASDNNMNATAAASSPKKKAEIPDDLEKIIKETFKAPNGGKKWDAKQAKDYWDEIRKTRPKYSAMRPPQAEKVAPLYPYIRDNAPDEELRFFASLVRRMHINHSSLGKDVVNAVLNNINLEDLYNTKSKKDMLVDKENACLF